MVDGQGNLIAPDGYLYPPVTIRIGRDLMRGPRCWSLEIFWNLRDPNEIEPGEYVYARRWTATLSLSGH